MEPKAKTYTVWVGNLSAEVTEAILFSEFEHYGPICNVKLQQSRDGRPIGFINFYSKEVAEVAANDMDDAIICGINVKASFKNEEHKPKDFRPLTDCQHFMEKSCKKGESCIFRHNESAKMSSMDCPNWLQRECMNRSCNYRHPGKTAMSNNKVFPKDTIYPAHSAPIHNQTNQVDKKGSKLPTYQNYQNLPVVQNTDAGTAFVGTYWDIENCRLPSNMNTHSFVEKIRRKFLEGKTLLEFVCACDTTRMNKFIIDGLSKEEVDVLHVSATAKNAADDKLKLRMQEFGFKYKKQAVLILISGDVNFAPVLHSLRYSLQVYIVLIHNRQASNQLTALADEKYVFDEFIADIPRKVFPSTLRTTKLLVTNIPFENVLEGMAITRLRDLCDTFGGVVGPICRDKSTTRANCVVSFASANDADRAHRSMQGKDVCGRKIFVEQYLGNGKVESNKQDVACGFNKRQDKTSLHRTQRLGGANAKNSISLTFVPCADPPLQPFDINSNMRQTPNERINNQGRPLNGPANGHKQKHFQHPKLKKAASQGSINYGTPNAYSRFSPIQPVPTIQDASSLADKVKLILSDFPHWFSLKRFAAKFNEIFKERCYLPQLSRLGNVIIDGRPGRIFVCLRSSSMEQVPFRIDKADFHEKLISLMTLHKRSVPIESILGMMWSYNNYILRQDPSGIPLIPLISSFTDVKLQNSKIFLSSRRYDMTKNPSRFIAEAELILSCGNDWEISLQNFPKSYKSFFGAAILEIPDIQHFINVFAAGTLEILPRNGIDFIVFSVSKRKEILGNELHELLLTTKNQRMPITLLRGKYFAFYGRDFPNSRNIDDLISHIKALSRNDLQVFEEKDGVMYIGAKKAPGESFKKFKQGLVSLLHMKDDKKILLDNLESEYTSFHGSFPVLRKLGFGHPHDLFEAMQPEIAVMKTTNGFVIYLSETAQLSMWDYVLEAMRSSNEHSVMLSSLPQYIQDSKEFLLSSIPSFVTAIIAGKSIRFELDSKFEEKRSLTKKEGRNYMPGSAAEIDSRDLAQIPDSVLKQVNDSTANAAPILDSEDLIDLSDFSDSTMNLLSDKENDLLDLSQTEPESDRDLWMQGISGLSSSPIIKPEPVVLGDGEIVGNLITLEDDSSESETDSENGRCEF